MSAYQTVRAAGCGLAAMLAATALANVSNPTITYPESKRLDLVETLHGVPVPDPYRWLEDANSAETKSWIEAQNKVTFGWLDQIPERAAIRARMTKILDYERYSAPFKEGGRYFWSRNDGLQPQSVLYVAESLTDTPRVLLDPNTLSKDGTIALAGTSVSPNGKLLAYALSSGGSDWIEWRVRDIDTGKDLSDVVKWSKFSGASWTKDSTGFFYSAYDEPKEGQALQQQNFNQKLYFHKIGTPQSEDKLIYERPDQPTWGFGGGVTEDGRYLIISVWTGTERENRVFYKDLRQADSKVVELIPEPDASYNFIGNVGPILYFETDKNAPMGKVISISTSFPKPEDWQTVLPEQKSKLSGISMVANRLVATYLQDAHSAVKMHDLDGKHIKDLELPGLGTAGGFGGKLTDEEAFYTYTSFVSPPTIYRYDFEKGESTVFRTAGVDFDPTKYTTEQVFFTSKDGTRVPMFITYRKGLKKDGSNPVRLSGYGGFNSSSTPYFSALNAVWLEMGGVFVVANIRGGGEYGNAWHDAGRLKNKQNCFDDFIAAAEHLIKEGWTSTPKLSIEGGSNGGLLVGACIVQRPDLFGAALPAVGVLDMLRFHKFTIGWAWKSDYGDPDKEEDFKTLLAYSPYHNATPGVKYPPTLITTGDHDDRVVPLHSFKFAAALQHAQAGDAPILIRIETRAGHGAGKPIQKVIEESSDEFAFLVRSLNMKLPAGFGK